MTRWLQSAAVGVLVDCGCQSAGLNAPAGWAFGMAAVVALYALLGRKP